MCAVRRAGCAARSPELRCPRAGPGGAPIACAECRHPMYAKTSRSGLRFFAHAPHAPDCEIARQGESEAHHLLKLELASAARDAGAHAEMEVRAPDGSWRADVLATDPGGGWTMALEAQLSPITAADITARTVRMREHGVTSCWFSDRPRPPRLGTVPSIRLAADADGGLTVVEGLLMCSRRDRPGSTVPDRPEGGRHAHVRHRTGGRELTAWPACAASPGRPGHQSGCQTCSSTVAAA
ncbi:competence protein CoiA [Streptomyces decoyicus]|uniref:competence protein CoiA n=1 Tax=Streptomyces decoyicus TaxID=249567 RepID=UPI0033B4F332